MPTPYDETPGEAPVFATACGWTLQGALQSRFWYFACLDGHPPVTCPEPGRDRPDIGQWYCFSSLLAMIRVASHNRHTHVR